VQRIKRQVAWRFNSQSAFSRKAGCSSRTPWNWTCPLAAVPARKRRPTSKKSCAIRTETVCLARWSVPGTSLRERGRSAALAPSSTKALFFSPSRMGSFGSDRRHEIATGADCGGCLMVEEHGDRGDLMQIARRRGKRFRLRRMQAFRALDHSATARAPRLVLRGGALVLCKTKCRSTFRSQSAHRVLPTFPCTSQGAPVAQLHSAKRHLVDPINQLANVFLIRVLSKV
jgi:hypothetical protein